MTTASLKSEPLRVDRLSSGKRRLVRDLVVDIGQPVAGLEDFTSNCVSLNERGHHVVTVPRCFSTDFSSIPAIFRPLYRFSTVDIAGCVHDLAYRIRMPQQPADRMWEIVASSGSSRANRLPRWRAKLGYWALRVGGGFAYDSTPDEVAAAELLCENCHDDTPATPCPTCGHVPPPPPCP